MGITFVSFFNTSNIGDKLLSNSLKVKIENYDKVSVFDFQGNNSFDESIDIQGKEIKIKNNDNKKLKFIESMSKLKLGWLFSFISLKRSNFSNQEFEKSIQNSHALVIGGGNMIFDLLPYGMWSKTFGYYVNYAKRMNKPVFAMSIGIGPFQNNVQYKYAIDSLSKCDYITFRDYKSYSLFKKMAPDYEKAWVVPDPVFSLPYQLNEQTTELTIGVNVIDSEVPEKKINSQRLIENYVELIEKVILELKCKVIIYNTEASDFDTCKLVYEKIHFKDNVELIMIEGKEDLIETYSKLSLVIGTRMHSMITAYSQKIPIVGLSWQQKVDAMFELIEDYSVVSLEDLAKEIPTVISFAKEKILHPDIEKYKRVKQKLLMLEKKNDEILLEVSGDLK